MRKVDGRDDLIRMNIPEDVGREEAIMESRTVVPLSYRVRRELLARVVPRYQQASSAHKSRLLDVFVELTGYDRKYAIGALMDHGTARNRALLWLFWETGLLVTEVCGLRLADVDREQGYVRIQQLDESKRAVPLGANALQHLLWYLDQSRLVAAKAETGEGALFLSERHRPLTPNAITLLFLRLSSHAGMSEKGVTPSLLRDTFAVRYLQQGGHPKTLQKLLGLASKAALKRYQHAARSLPYETPAQSMTEASLS